MARPSGWHRKRATPADLARAKQYASREHRQERARRIAAHTAQSPCSCCGNPLGPNRRLWHLPHTPDRTGYFPGLWCARCNLREAAQRGARVVNATRRITPLRW